MDDFYDGYELMEMMNGKICDELGIMCLGVRLQCVCPHPRTPHADAPSIIPDCLNSCPVIRYRETYPHFFPFPPPFFFPFPFDPSSTASGRFTVPSFNSS